MLFILSSLLHIFRKKIDRAWTGICEFWNKRQFLDNFPPTREPNNDVTVLLCDLPINKHSTSLSVFTNHIPSLEIFYYL